MKIDRHYGVIAMLSCSVLLVSNIVAVKLFNFYDVAVDGGIVLFPISYVVGDVAVELYGKKEARKIIVGSFLVNLVAVMVFLIVEKLPAYPNWHGQEAYEAILGFTPRLVAGSLLAYLMSSLLNNVIFVRIRQKTGEQKLYVRALTSSVVARLVDSAIFETVAFLGVLSLSEFLRQAAFAYAAGMLLEVLLTPLTYAAVKFCRRHT